MPDLKSKKVPLYNYKTVIKGRMDEWEEIIDEFFLQNPNAILDTIEFDNGLFLGFLGLPQT